MEIPYRKIHPQFIDTFRQFGSVPDLTQESLWNYLAYGISPGGFLTSVLCNDFTGAMCKADHTWNGQSFRDLAMWLIHRAPRESYGNSEKMQVWMKWDDIKRREIMIDRGLRPSVVDILAGRGVA